MELNEYFEHIEKTRAIVGTIQPYLSEDELAILVKTLSIGSISMLLNKE